MMGATAFSARLRRWVLVLALGCGSATLVGCEVGVDYPYPPDVYIGTTEPVYFEGRANYWYDGRWYYRDGGRWRYWNREPGFLFEHRSRVAPVRRNYEPRRVVGHPPPRREGTWHR